MVVHLECRSWGVLVFTLTHFSPEIGFFFYSIHPPKTRLRRRKVDMNLPLFTLLKKYPYF